MATPLYPLLQKFIQDEWVRLEAQQITPWAFFKSHFGTICSDFHGTAISSGGFEFSGSCRDRFWNRYIEPFLEDLTCRSFVYVRQMANDRHLDAKPALQEAAGLLGSVTRRAYARMAEIDQRLRGGGNPASVPRYSPDKEQAAMEGFIALHVRAEIAALGRLRWLENFNARYPFLLKVLGATVVFLAGAALTWAFIPTDEGKLRGVEILERVTR